MKLPFADPETRLDFARGVVRAEAVALAQTADGLDRSFLDAVDRLLRCRGRVVVSGTGKSADVGAKIAGTLSSTGTRAYVLDATRAVHGDLGMVHPDDIALILSHSGESDEIVRLIGPLRDLISGIVALTGSRGGTLARQADVAIVYGPLAEADPLGLAPSTSTTAMIALGDALAFSLARQRGFGADDFARFHPGGSLGRKLVAVDAVMRRGPEVRLASADATVREVFGGARRRGRRTGAVMLVEADGRLCGLFTDSDLARLIEQRRDDALDRPIRSVMTANPRTVRQGARLTDAIELLKEHKISELPVVDAAGRPAGIVDITDLIGVDVAEETTDMPPVRIAG